MKIVGFWGKFNLLEFFSYKKSLYGIRSIEVFHEILKRERARCDRNGYKFSLIVIDPVKIKEHNGAIIDLLIALRRRLRLADEIGWFDQNKVGVMLPDTPAKGAWNISKEISDKFGSGLSTISFMVYTYPPEWEAGNDQPSLRISFSNKDSKNRRLGREYRSTSSEAPSYTQPSSNSAKITIGAGGKCMINFQMPFVLGIPIWKRILDIVGSLIGILLLCPLMLLIAITIKLTSPGNVIFHQKRMGYGCIPFEFFKFRTMVFRAPDDLHKDYLRSMIQNSKEMSNGGFYKIKEDPRVTPFGSFLRRWSLDELPQLFNVLKGDMSLVGPRPEPCYAYDNYNSWYHRRSLDTKPGITGLWQVEGRSRVSYENMIRMDLRYSQNISFVNDLRLIFRTFKAVLGRAGAY